MTNNDTSTAGASTEDRIRQVGALLLKFDALMLEDGGKNGGGEGGVARYPVEVRPQVQALKTKLEALLRRREKEQQQQQQQSEQQQENEAVETAAPRKAFCGASASSSVSSQSAWSKLREDDRQHWHEQSTKHGRHPQHSHTNRSNNHRSHHRRSHQQQRHHHHPYNTHHHHDDHREDDDADEHAHVVQRVARGGGGLRTVVSGNDDAFDRRVVKTVNEQQDQIDWLLKQLQRTYHASTHASKQAEFEQRSRNEVERCKMNTMAHKMEELQTLFDQQQWTIAQLTRQCEQANDRPAGTAGARLLAEKSMQAGLERGERVALERRYHTQSDALHQEKQEHGECKLALERLQRAHDDLTFAYTSLQDKHLNATKQSDKQQHDLHVRVAELTKQQQHSDAEKQQTGHTTAELQLTLAARTTEIDELKRVNERQRQRLEYADAKVASLSEMLERERSELNRALLRAGDVGAAGIDASGDAGASAGATVGNGGGGGVSYGRRAATGVGGKCRDFASVVFRMLATHYKKVAVRERAARVFRNDDDVDLDSSQLGVVNGTGKVVHTHLFSKYDPHDAARRKQAHRDASVDHAECHSQLQKERESFQQQIRTLQLQHDHEVRYFKTSLESRVNVKQSLADQIHEAAIERQELVDELAAVQKAYDKQKGQVAFLVESLEAEKELAKTQALTADHKNFAVMMFESFKGDYLRLQNDPHIVHAMFDYDDETVLFTDYIKVFNDVCKEERRVLVIAAKNVYVFTPKKQEYELNTVIPIHQLQLLGLSRLATDVLALHNKSRNDFLCITPKRAEIVYCLTSLFQNSVRHKLNFKYGERLWVGSADMMYREVDVVDTQLVKVTRPSFFQPPQQIIDELERDPDQLFGLR